MQQFTPLEYIKIAIANHYGLDKFTWQGRIGWFNTLTPTQLDDLVPEADEPILMKKMLHTYFQATKGIASGAPVGLDATASGLQILACLIGCHDTARSVNLINTGKREDVYERVAKHMSQEIGHDIPRSKLKKPIMT